MAQSDLTIGPYSLPNRLFLAPMAGVTDRPFRQLCRRLGAGMAVSEMITANKALWASKKSLLRANHDGEPEPRSVQIAGIMSIRVRILSISIWAVRRKKSAT